MLPSFLLRGSGNDLFGSVDRKLPKVDLKKRAKNLAESITKVNLSETPTETTDGEKTEEDVIVASKRIGVHDFIMNLPKGYNYVVGERGITLSSGQRQLIAFLRVYLRNPSILVLDEATSSIDSYTEDILQLALSKVCEGRTTIIIAHRLSTIRDADSILLLEDGVIIEQGNHHQFMIRNGKYKQMYDAQFTQDE